MKNLNDKNFDTAIDDDNVTASQHITEVALLDDNQSDFVNKFLVEGMVRTCDYMVKNNNLAIKGFESAIDTEFRNNPEQPSESVIVKQIRVNYPDWVLGGSSSNTLSKAQKDKLVAEAKKRVAAK